MLAIKINLSDLLLNWLCEGAFNTVWVAVNNDKLKDLMDLLIKIYPEPVEIETINNFLMSETDYIYEQLGIDLVNVYLNKKDKVML